MVRNFVHDHPHLWIQYIHIQG